VPINKPNKKGLKHHRYYLVLLSSKIIERFIKIGKSTFSMADTPYVTYKIEARIKDKGIGYAAKHTLQNHFKAQGLPCAISDLTVTDDSVSMTLSIYPGDKDIFIKSMHEALYKKGRMPSKEHLQPEFSITPVPYENSTQAEKKDVSWDKLMEKLNADIISKTKDLEKLHQYVGAIQEILAEKENQVDRLQSQLQASRDYTPLEALIYTHLPAGASVMEDIALDFLCLMENNDIDLTHLALYPNPFSTYVNIKENTNFQSDGELERALVNANSNSWEKSIEGQELLSAKTLYECELGILEGAKKVGVSPELIKDIESKIDHNAGELLEGQVDYSKRMHKEAKKIESHIETLRQNYKTLMEISENCRLRAEKKTRLPIVLYTTAEGQYVYLPDADQDFQKKLAHYCNLDVEDTGHLRINFLDFNSLDMDPETIKTDLSNAPELKEKIDNADKLLKVFHMLGVKPDVAELTHHEGHVISN
jgi:hypothetical protein